LIELETNINKNINKYNKAHIIDAYRSENETFKKYLIGLRTKINKR